MAEIEKLVIDGKTMQSIYTKIGISFDRFVEILDRDFYTPTLTAAPTASTLTYTDTDGSECEFRIGQFCRVVDSSVEGGYKIYQCVDIQSGVSGTFVSWQADLASLKAYVESELEKIVVTSNTEPEEAEIWIDTSEEPEPTIGIKDAPADGKLYGRKNSSWQETQLAFTDKVASSWVEDSTYSDYPYRCDIACSGVTANDYAEVIFDIEQATSGEYAPLCETNTNIVSIWSATNTSITIPTIIITK